MLKRIKGKQQKKEAYLEVSVQPVLPKPFRGLLKN
jgi:hypothetical protein